MGYGLRAMEPSIIQFICSGVVKLKAFCLPFKLRVVSLEPRHLALFESKDCFEIIGFSQYCPCLLRDSSQYYPSSYFKEESLTLRKHPSNCRQALFYPCFIYALTK